MFIDAGRALLERKAPEGYLEEWGKNLMKGKAAEREGARSVLIFCLGEEWYALSTQTVREIIEETIVHVIPHRSDHVLLGLVSVRGNLLLCFSLHDLLGLDGNKAGRVHRRAYKRMVVVEWDGWAWVFPVDEVIGMGAYDANVVDRTPVTLGKACPEFSTGFLDMDGNRVALIDENVLCPVLNRRLGQV